MARLANIPTTSYLGCVTFFILVLQFTGSIRATSAYRTAEGKDCIQNDLHGCSCKFTDGSGIVDLTSLGSQSNGSARFVDVKQDDGNDTFSFSPCLGFTQGNCTNVSVCLTTNKSNEMTIGDINTAMYMYDSDHGNLEAAYNHESSTIIKVSEVTLICDMNACDPVLTAQGRGSGEEYMFKFTLTTVCACAGMCSAAGPANCGNTGGSNSLSGGSIFLIIVVCAAALYLLVGMTVNVVRQRAISTDVIPHKEFWVGLPRLLKSGVLFVFSICTRRQYENMTT